MKRYTPELINKVLSEYQEIKSVKTIIQKYGISKSTLFYWIKKYKVIIQYDRKEITITDYKKLIKELERAKLIFEIYENLHCFKDASTYEKEIAISKLIGVYPTKLMCKILNLPHGTFYNYHFRKNSYSISN